MKVTPKASNRNSSDLYKDFTQNPDNWKRLDIYDYNIPSTRRGNKGGRKIGRAYMNRETGEVVYINKVVDKYGVPVRSKGKPHIHFEPYKPAKHDKMIKQTKRGA